MQYGFFIENFALRCLFATFFVLLKIHTDRIVHLFCCAFMHTDFNVLLYAASLAATYSNFPS